MGSETIGPTSATYRIFGKAVRVVTDSAEGGRILRDELSLYPALSPDGEPDLLIERLPIEVPAGALYNPRQHVEHADGFTAHFTMASVRFVFEEDHLKSVRFYENTSGGALLNQARRWADIQFTTRAQRTGVVFHEMALVPATFFLPDLALVHASALEDRDGKVVLIGGTGGVGKTSLELELCRKGSFRFVADDVCAVGHDGHVWPNLAFPKIYAYNLEDDRALRERVLAERPLLDRAHWAALRRLGPSSVRRRLSPDELFEGYSTGGGHLRLYVVLAREDRRDIRVEELPPDRAARLTSSVLATEYHEFNNHLQWHLFNRGVRGQPPVRTVRGIHERWRLLLERVFSGVTCRLVRIPISLEHSTFKREVAGLLR